MNQPIRVLFCMQSAGDTHGVTHVLLALLPYLPEQGIEAHVALPESGPLQQTLEKLNIPLIIEPAEVFFGKHPFNAHRYCSELPQRAQRIADYIVAHDIDLVHSNTHLHFDGAYAALYSQRPHVWNLHGIFGMARDACLFKALPHSHQEILQCLDSLCHAHLTVSNAATESLRQFHCQQPMTTIANGFNYDDFQNRLRSPQQPFNLRQQLNLPPDTPIVGTVSRIEDQKDLPTYIQVAARIRQVKPDVHFVHIGRHEDAALKTQLDQLIEEYKLTDHVHFIGPLHDLPHVYPQFDLFMLTSKHEGLALVLLEAMAAGCAVVSTRSGGAEQILDKDGNSLATEVGDVEQLVAHALRVLTDSDCRAALQKAAPAYMQRYPSWQQTASYYADAYRALLAEPGSQPLDPSDPTEQLQQWITDCQQQLDVLQQHQQKNTASLTGFRRPAAMLKAIVKRISRRLRSGN